jgi:peptide/nickel transport system permease protein
VILVLVSIFAYVLAPDNSENANQMHLSIHSKPPGFVNMLSIPLEERQEKTLSNYF